ncbi:O-antigen ligase [Arachnia propionica]|nr:O-antigen ligase family protein [Arachnia propionica]MDO5083885.1 O-antigen ligase family protein [Arachnia propionica]
MTEVLPTTRPVRRGGEFFIALAAFAVVFQVPGNTLLSLLLPPLALLWGGIRVGRSSPGGWSVSAWLALSLLPAFIAGVAYDQFGSRSYFIVTLAATLTALAVFRGQDPVKGAYALIKGVFWALVAMAVIGVLEVLTGFKLLYIRYPDAAVTSWVQDYEWFTTAMYPNYNDFSVALVILGLFLTARAFLGRTGAATKVLCLGTVFVLAVWVLAMGSRGALLGMVAGVGLLVLFSQRMRDRTSIPPWLLTLAGCVVLAGVLVVAMSSYVQDEDTSARGEILLRIWAFISREPVRALIGFGSPDHLQNLSDHLTDGALINPHNLLAENLLWGGVPALVGYLLVWGVVLVAALRNRIPTNWSALAAVTVTLVMPVLGVTPSVILHYLYPQYLLIASLVLLRTTGDGSSAAP